MISTESEKKYKVPDWLPDWREISAYPDPKNGVSDEQWAWEFLRRNATYQRLYRTGSRCKEKWYKKNPDDHRFHRYFNGIPKIERDESFNKYLSRCSNEKIEPQIKPKNPLILKNFPVLKFSSKLNPKNSDPPKFNRDYGYPLEFLAEDFDGDEFVYDIKDFDEVLLVFSCALPISEQIKKADAFLKITQQQYEEDGNSLAYKGRCRPNNYRDYLRYLDADLNGVKQVEMAKIIHKGQDGAADRVNKGLKQAIKYRDKDYLKILKTQILN